jgi:hypothetical protein
MTLMKWINTDKISENSPNPCHPCSDAYKLQVASKWPNIIRQPTP